ncbi:MAG: SusD/RagB family nutrient-binding outer membrane lipoprotein [Chryseolinea sp.]
MKKFNSILRSYSSILLMCTVVVAISCTSDYEEINTNKNAIADLQTSQLPFLFSYALQNGTNSGWSYQVAQNLFHDQYAQYFANTTTYFPSDRYVIRFDWIGSLWDPLYTATLPQLQTLMEKYDPASAEYAIANIWWVVAFQRVTDTWGPIPYFNAGKIAPFVEYDAQDKIYDDFFKRLETAVTVLKGKTGEVPYGSYDIIYGGDVNKWIKFANTLRLRLAVRISNVDAGRAKTEGENAAAAGLMTTSPTDDALLAKSIVNSDVDGLSVMDWNEFRMSSAMESVLKGYHDPRIGVYFNPTQQSIDANLAANSGKYNKEDVAHPLDFNGLRNGLPAADMAVPLNNFAANSRHGVRWNSFTTDQVSYGDYVYEDGVWKATSVAKSYPAGQATPVNVMAAAEAYFLRAEGVLLGWNMGGGSAKDYYEAGIKTSMAQWGITGDAAIAAYTASAAVPIAPGDAQNSPPLSTVAVAFSGTKDAQLEQIAIQKWLALYPDGNEAWADVRRHGYMKLYPVVKSDNADISDPTTQTIKRIPFMLSEKASNTRGVETGVPLLGGADKVTTPLWWDKN